MQASTPSVRSVRTTSHGRRRRTVGAVRRNFHELDRGETAAICYAIENDADLVLLDERDGRQVARRHDLSVTGVIGVLLRGANTGDVELKRELDALREAGFWISDELYSKVLSKASE